jgi:hypothetical protein
MKSAIDLLQNKKKLKEPEDYCVSGFKTLQEAYQLIKNKK